MRTYGDKFIVKYNRGDIKNYDLGSGIVIEIAAECNTDVRGYHEQVGIVVSAPEGHDFFKNGDKVLTHYLASSDGNAFIHNGETFHKVTLPQIFAKVNEDDSLSPAEDVYFCREVSTVSKTQSGIFLTTSGDERVKMKLKVTHTPELVNQRWADDKINIGDIIMSQDDYNYTFTYNKESYVKIEQKFIAGVYVNEEESPCIN